MKGYVAQKGGRFYAVIYEGLDPVTGRERRCWHAAGTNREDAERLAGRLAADQQGRADAVRALTFGAYLTRQWLPGIIPALGHIKLRRLRYPQIETFYDHLLAPTADRPGLSPKTVYGIHLSSGAHSPKPCAAGWSAATSPCRPVTPAEGDTHNRRPVLDR